MLMKQLQDLSPDDSQLKGKPVQINTEVYNVIRTAICNFYLLEPYRQEPVEERVRSQEHYKHGI